MNRNIDKTKLQEVRHYSPPNAVIKQGDHGLRLLLASASFAALTPLQATEDDPTVLEPWDGTAGKAIVLSQFAKTVTTANEQKVVIINGIYRISEINWPEGLSDAEKQAAFQGTPLSVAD